MADQIFHVPQHPYTWGLLKSIPRLDNPRDEELVPIAGRPPSLINRPSGCHFHPRCPYALDAHKRIDAFGRPAAKRGCAIRLRSASISSVAVGHRAGCARCLCNR